MTSSTLRAVCALTAYVAAIVSANVLTARYGLVPVAPGLLVTAGTYSAGLALLARDAVQDTVGLKGTAAAIGAGAGLSWVLASPQLAVASAAAFAVAELADFAVYTPLRARSWAAAVVASNTVGALLDTVVFLTLAGFALTADAVAGQLLGKVVLATGIPVLIVLAVRGVTGAVPVRRRRSVGA